jgi:signal transduction histidine kinase
MKLAAALAVPLVGLLFVTALEVVRTADHVDRVRSQTQLARASIGPAGLIHNLQNERTWAAADLIGAASQIQAEVKGYDATRAATNESIALFRDAVAGAGPAVRESYGPALAALDQLEKIRSRIDTRKAPKTLADNAEFGNGIFDGYSKLITPFFDANTRVALAVDDAQLRRWTTLTDIAARQGELIANLARRTILFAVVGDGVNTPAEIKVESELNSTWNRLNAELQEAPEPYAEVVGRRFPTDLVSNLSEQVDNALKGEPVPLAPFLEALNIPPEESFIGMGNELSERLSDRADALDDQATARERLYIAIAVVTLFAALLLSWVVTRSITRPLRSLTRQAKDMAERLLPNAVSDILETPLGDDVAMPEVEPVRVDTSDEVADVASALTTVQETALDLAVEQAVLRRNIADSFVNLGRRNQSLLGRQLDFITELESNETDPDALANLFRLDHLATRMRRNAESLLVLAGFDPPRKWAAPVRLTDVIRAALGEVEDYQRVAVRGIEPATILGSAAADLAHLLAELVENALVFSPPDQTVDVRGRQRNEGPPSNGAYTLAIIDTGLGMPAADLEAANRRLAGAESFTIAPSKYLGHYVAGNLAARHGITVHLDNSPGNGVTATITLPASLLTTATALADPVTPPRGQRAVRLRSGSPPAVGGPAPALPGGPTPRTGPVPAVPTAPAGPARPPASAPVAHASGDRIRPPAAMPLRIPGAGIVLPAGATGPARPTPGPNAPGPGLPRRPIPMGPAGPHAPAGPAARPVPTGAPPPALWPRSGAGRLGGGATRPAPPRPDDRTLLDALGRYAPPGGDVGGRGPGPARPPTTPLTQRVRGAQLPQTRVVRLRGDGSGPMPPGGARPSAAAHASAADVQSLLTNFSAGVQRGLAESRRNNGGVPASNGRHGRR